MGLGELGCLGISGLWGWVSVGVYLLLVWGESLHVHAFTNQEAGAICARTQNHGLQVHVHCPLSQCYHGLVNFGYLCGNSLSLPSFAATAQPWSAPLRWKL